MNADADVCKLLPEQEVGPYYVADELLRADIREGKPGLPLTLQIAVLDSRTCKPLTNAAIDVWHCDALGLYSGYTKMDPTGFGGLGGPGGPPGGPPPGGPPPGFDPQSQSDGAQHPDPTHPRNRPGPPEGFGSPPENHPTDKLTFLRGVQLTDATGAVTFRTVVPGFYMGRTNHIHYKVRLGGHTGSEAAMPKAGMTYLAGHTSHTGQIFLPEELAAELMRHEPYSKHAIHRTRQAEDMVYNGQHGELCIATFKPLHPGNTSVGFTAHIITAVDPTATPQPAGPGCPGGPGRPPRGPHPQG